MESSQQSNYFFLNPNVNLKTQQYVKEKIYWMGPIRKWRWEKLVCELKNGSIKLTQSEEQRGKKVDKRKTELSERPVGQSQKFYLL